MTKPKLFKEGIFVASYALVSKAMGVVREIAMAYFFGASGVVDAYRIALTAVLLPVDTLGGSALGNSFIPTFKHLLTGRKSRLGWLLANQVLMVLVLGTVVVALVLMLFP
jgi:putative peptidoglycan lipid II flippase